MKINRLRQPGGTQGGFTLFEVIIGLTILSMLAGSVYAIILRAGETAAEVREFDQRDEQVSRFLSMMQRTIESMPQGGRITMAAPAETGTGFHEMTITDAMTAFSFGENPATAGETIIGMRPQSEEESAELIGSEMLDDTLFQIAISREDFAPGDTDGDGMVFRAGAEDVFMEADEEGRYWLPLLNHVTAMSWRFWDEDQRNWLEEWTDDSRMPPMLELSLDDPYRPAPVRLVFDLPDHLTEEAPQSGGSTGDSDDDDTQTATTSTRATPAPATDRPATDQPRQRPGGGDGRGPGRGKGFGKGGGKGPGKGGGRPGGGGGGPGGGGGAPPGNPGGGGGRN